MKKYNFKLGKAINLRYPLRIIATKCVLAQKSEVKSNKIVIYQENYSRKERFNPEIRDKKQ